MKSKIQRAGWIASIAFAMLAVLALQTQAQTEVPQQNAAGPAQAQTNQAEQMLGPLNLTQEQALKIRAINQELRSERQAANMRLRLAQRALAEAIQSSTPDETVIAQRSKEVADAQANTIRLRSLTEARVLQVLTPEQRVKLREIREANSRNQKMRRGGNQQMPRVLNRRQDGLQRNTNNPNSNTQLGPRQQRKLLKQQQKP